MALLRDVAKDLQLTNHNISPEHFYALLKRCRRWDFEWGMIFALKNDVHIHILTRYRKRVFLRPALRQVAQDLFYEYEVITTKINKSKPAALKFDLKMGWNLTGETDNEWHLSMTEKDFRYGKS